MLARRSWHQGVSGSIFRRKSKMEENNAEQGRIQSYQLAHELSESEIAQVDGGKCEVNGTWNNGPDVKVTCTF